MHTSPVNLVADIGGTNARFALVDSVDGLLHQKKNYCCADFPELIDAVRAYLKDVSHPQLSNGVFSLATSIDSDQLGMTNHDWQFSVAELRQGLGLTSLKIINDFTSLALALPYLSDSECQKIGGGQSVSKQAMAVLGPGTGLGVSAIIKSDDHWLPVQGEGGHVSYGPMDQSETLVIDYLHREYDHVSAERLVSGPGLLLLYQTIAKLQGRKAGEYNPDEITAMALQRTCDMAEKAVSMFCAVLGTVAGDLALTVGAKGGVYIGGGIVPKLGNLFGKSDFRRRFENHGRFTRYLEKIPTYVV